jgi:hypothetical protein
MRLHGRGSATSASFVTARPDGLRPVSGYRSYEDCGRVTSACAGRVPATLRRPLRLTKLASGQRCPVTRQHVVHGDFPGALGRGPIYADVSEHNGLVRFVYPPPRAGSGRQFAGSNWSGFKVLWVSRPCSGDARRPQRLPYADPPRATPTGSLQVLHQVDSTRAVDVQPSGAQDLFWFDRHGGLRGAGARRSIVWCPHLIVSRYVPVGCEGLRRSKGTTRV